MGKNCNLQYIYIYPETFYVFIFLWMRRKQYKHKPRQRLLDYKTHFTRDSKHRFSSSLWNWLNYCTEKQNQWTIDDILQCEYQVVRTWFSKTTKTKVLSSQLTSVNITWFFTFGQYFFSSSLFISCISFWHKKSSSSSWDKPDDLKKLLLFWPLPLEHLDTNKRSTSH